MTATILNKVTAAFLASFVEVAEAITIIPAAGPTRGWRPSVTGTALALPLLLALVRVCGTLMALIPIHALQFVGGALLTLVGMRWLRKAILRTLGVLVTATL